MTEFNMKLSMVVDLIGYRKVKITLRYINDMLLLDKNNISKDKLYYDKSNNIYIWSFQDFIFDERQIRLPEKKYLFNIMTHTHKFSTEKDRYNTLKKYYNTLNKWSNDIKIKNTINNYKNGVTMFDNWWFVK